MTQLNDGKASTDQSYRLGQSDGNRKFGYWFHRLHRIKGSALCRRPWTLEVHACVELSEQRRLVQARNLVSLLAFLCFLMATEHVKCMQAKSNFLQEGQMEHRWKESEKSREEARRSGKRKGQRKDDAGAKTP